MTEAFYELTEESDPGRGELSARVRSTVHTTGPWAAGLQHAGPPSALLTRCVRLLGGLPARALPARLTFDILSPVPVADLVVTARTLRPGRKVALAEATLVSRRLPRPTRHDTARLDGPAARGGLQRDPLGPTGHERGVGPGLLASDRARGHPQQRPRSAGDVGQQELGVDVWGRHPCRCQLRSGRRQQLPGRLHPRTLRRRTPADLLPA